MPRKSAAAVFTLVLAGAAAAHGVSTYVEGVEDAVTAARSGATGAEIRALDRMDAALGKHSNERSIANEVKAVSKSAKILETALAGTEIELALRDAHDQARGSYHRDLVASLEALDGALGALHLPESARRKIQKARDGTDAALAPLRKAAPDPATLSGALTLISDGFSAAKGFTPWDDGNDSVWVVSEFFSVPAAQSPDLDGDRDGDNALQGLAGLAGVDPAALANETLGTAEEVALLWLWGVHALKKDALAFASLSAGEDRDGEPSDNFSGTEPFAVTSVLAGDGRPTPRSFTKVSAGRFAIDLSGAAVAVGGFVVPAEGIVKVDGTVDPGADAPVTGRIAMGLPIDAVTQFMEAQGITVDAGVLALLGLAADLDLDGNGSMDGISLCLGFRAVPTGELSTDR